MRVLLAIAILVAARPAAAVTFTDTHLVLRKTWTLSQVGIGSNPPSPAGLVFSADGSKLYLALTPTNQGQSAFYELTVDRTGGRVTNLRLPLRSLA